MTDQEARAKAIELYGDRARVERDPHHPDMLIIYLEGYYREILGWGTSWEKAFDLARIRKEATNPQ